MASPRLCHIIRPIYTQHQTVTSTQSPLSLPPGTSVSFCIFLKITCSSLRSRDPREATNQEPLCVQGSAKEGGGEITL